MLLTIIYCVTEMRVGECKTAIVECCSDIAHVTVVADDAIDIVAHPCLETGDG